LTTPHPGLYGAAAQNQIVAFYLTLSNPLRFAKSGSVSLTQSKFGQLDSKSSAVIVVTYQHSGSGCGDLRCASPIAKDGKLRRPFWSDRLELRLLLVAQVCIKILKRIAHQLALTSDDRP
jgi:hypothetical protein